MKRFLVANHSAAECAVVGAVGVETSVHRLAVVRFTETDSCSNICAACLSSSHALCGLLIDLKSQRQADFLHGIK